MLNSSKEMCNEHHCKSVLVYKPSNDKANICCFQFPMTLRNHLFGQNTLQLVALKQFLMLCSNRCVNITIKHIGVTLTTETQL